jgi:poly-beta-1,6-N-acetyl-D-glucosamine synthase
VSLFGLFYIYLGYPLLIRGLAKLRPMHRLNTLSESNSDSATSGPQQKVSIVIASFNDADRLLTKLEQLLAGAQSDCVGQILVGLDGATDDSAVQLTQFKNDRVRVVEFEQRRGKPAVLNDLVRHATCDIVVFCDARQILSDDAIPSLLANFADPSIGVVSGELTFRAADDETTAGRGIGAYWKYEKALRKAEARFRSVPGATGALYAVRRELFKPIPESTLLDDVVIPMQAIAAGYRCVFEPNAVAWDTPSDTIGKEAIRKRRTIAGAAQLILHHPEWLLPWRNPIWLEYVSHKIFRLLSPFLLILVCWSNCVLASDITFYKLMLILQSAFYYSAFAGWMCQRIGQPSTLFGIQLMFITLNMTTLAALWDSIRGRFRVTWQRSEAGPQSTLAQ